MPSDRAASGIAYLTVALLAAPMLGATARGQLDDWLGWRAGFVLVAAGSVVTGGGRGARAAGDPDSAADRRRARGRGPWRGPAGLLRLFAGVLTPSPPSPRRGASWHTRPSAPSTMATMLAFMAGGPYVTIDLMGLSAGTTAGLFAIAAGGYMAGNPDRRPDVVAARHRPDDPDRHGHGLRRQRPRHVGVRSVWGASMTLTLFGPFDDDGAGANGLTMPKAWPAPFGSRPDLAGTAKWPCRLPADGAGGARLASFAVGKLMGPSALPLVLFLLAVTLAALVLHTLALRRGVEAGPRDRPA